jgi:hypothetical protein
LNLKGKRNKVRKSTAIILFLLAIGIAGKAKDNNWAVSAIPDSLIKNAHAVIRLHEVSYSISGTDEYIMTEKIVVTVLDEKGRDHGRMTEFSRPMETIQDVYGMLYDKNGDEVKKMKKKDIVDMAAFGSSFVDDVRLKYHSFDYAQYPYTTEYEIEKKITSTFYLANFAPIPGTHCAVERASLRISYPKGFPLRYHNIKLPIQPTVSNVADSNILSLSVSGLKPLKEDDDFTPQLDKQFPVLLLAVDSFSLYGFHGSLKTWKDFGRCMYELNNKRDVLTPEVKSIVHKVADTCKTDKDKIAALYRYMQKNTRYVSIQLGIGGWQTFDAAFVCNKKYGDCKALTNFMKSMLKEMGITAYSCLVNAGAIPSHIIIDSFPCNVFNHAFLCVPLGKDTTWLECTSHDTPPGYLSSFTSGRKVLVCTPDGGIVVKTPTYGAETNVLRRTATLSLNENDELAGTIIQSCKGSFWDKEYHYVVAEGQSAANKYLNSSFGFADYKITQSSINDYSQQGLPELTEELKVTAPSEATKSGNSLILSTAAFPFTTIITSRTDTVHTSFEIYNSATTIDTVIINLGGNYSNGQPFKEINSAYPFGSYKMSYTLVNNNKLVKVSTFTLNAGVYPPEQFNNYKKLKNDAVGATRNKVILTKM